MNINNRHENIKLFEAEYQTNRDHHNVHSYPAKFPPQFPEKILKKFSKKNYIILDPFCGSGTTLVESMISGNQSIGSDINDIALLISKVKTYPYTKDQLEKIDNILSYLENVHYHEIEKTDIIVHFKGIDHWFQQNVQKELQYLLNILNKVEEEPVANALKLIMSDIIVKVSNQESDTRYAAINKNIPNRFTIKYFIKKGTLFLKKLYDFHLNIDYKLGPVEIIKNDARKLKDVQDNSVDLIITSPPYANTYDYYLYHKHRMNWLGYKFEDARELEIGSRNEYSSKKREIDKWSEDLYKALAEQKRVLKNNRYIFWIIGDSVIRKNFISIDEIVVEQCNKLNLEVVNIESDLLKKNSRKFNSKFGTQLEKKEHVIQIYKR